MLNSAGGGRSWTEWQEASGRNRTVRFGLQKKRLRSDISKHQELLDALEQCTQRHPWERRVHVLVSQSSQHGGIGQDHGLPLLPTLRQAVSRRHAAHPAWHQAAKRQKMQAEAVPQGSAAGCCHIGPRARGSGEGEHPGKEGKSAEPAFGPVLWGVPSVTAWELTRTSRWYIENKFIFSYQSFLQIQYFHVSRKILYVGNEKICLTNVMDWTNPCCSFHEVYISIRQ